MDCFEDNFRTANKACAVAFIPSKKEQQFAPPPPASEASCQKYLVD